jgi:ribosomal protein L37AE/L43A
MQQQKRQIGSVHSVFLQFGFGLPHDVPNTDQVVGSCPFCGAKDHFFVNKESKNSTWDCKKCGKAGGYKLFVEQIVKKCQAEFTETTASVLCQSRGIPFDIFKQVDAGYHRLTNQYIIPTIGSQGEILSVKVFNIAKNSFVAMAGQVLTMYLPKQSVSLLKARIVYICEGEWDTLALLHVLKALRVTDAYVIGVPGASIFKQDILPLLSGKDIILLYDNDEPGRNGSAKAEAALSISTVKSVTKIVWTNKYKNGFDIRDLYKMYPRQPKKILDEIFSMLAPVDNTGGVEVNTSQNYIKPIPCTEVYKTYRKWLYLPSTEILDVVFGTAISNKIPGDPLWMFIVSPPGGSKSVCLMPLSGSPLVESLSSLTPAALISGAPGFGDRDPSLIPRMRERIMVIKDYTAIMALPPLVRDEINGIFRDVFDGSCQRNTGSVVRSYRDVHFTIIAAVTPAIDPFCEQNASVGERFLRWRHILPSDPAGRIPYIKKALGNVSKEKWMGTELKEIAHQVIHANYGELPIISAAMENKVIDISQLVAIFRAAVNRNKYSKQIEHESFYELSTRIAKQMYKLLYGTTWFHGKKEVSDAEWNINIHTARSSITKRIYDAASIMYSLGRVTISDLSENLVLPLTTARDITEDLYTIGVVKKQKETDGNKIEWFLKDNIMSMIEKTGFCRKEIKYCENTKTH